MAKANLTAVPARSDHYGNEAYSNGMEALWRAQSICKTGIAFVERDIEDESTRLVMQNTLDVIHALLERALSEYDNAIESTPTTGGTK
jgi:hypothetical protein